DMSLRRRSGRRARLPRAGSASCRAPIAAIGGSLMVMPTAAHADVPCQSRTTTTPFKAWNDTNRYFVAPNGSFEAGTANWFLGGSASVVAENEPWKINGSLHARSMRLPSGASARVEKFCVNSDEDSIRFFFKRPSTVGAGLRVAIRVTSGVNVATNDYTVGGGTAGWGVSERIMLPDIRDASGQQWVEITFFPTNTAATWQIDDLMIDPWRTN
ncbi:MAG TPA: hypothetical protein PLV41_08460, partial [Miltoncostaeales bacterium]|nr:hypothetical protein [Miltoncostaeales bacterium]